MNLIVSDDFKTISLISDTTDANTDHPLVEVYVNQVLTYTLVVGGTATIGGTVYTTTTGADNADFASTTTTTGTKFIHNLTAATLTTGTGTVLTDGVWAIKFISSTGTTVFYKGVIIHDVIDACIMDRLDPACDGTCSLEKIIDEANKLYGLLYSAKISAKKGEFTNAQCKYNIASTLCSKCHV